MIKVDLTVSAELADLVKTRNLSMREEVCKMTDDSGEQFNVSRIVGSLTLIVSRVGCENGLHEAYIDFEPLVVKAAAALKEHRAAIEQLPAYEGEEVINREGL